MARTSKSATDAAAEISETSARNRAADRSQLPGAARAPIGNTRQSSPEDLARRAYEIYCERGREDGHDVDDWFQAERELNGPAE